ncbi:MAG: hypothetical protein PVI01_05955 [Gemmatimonadales bacterium]
MTPHGVRQWMARLGVIGGTAAILAGCPDNPDKLAEPGSQPSWDSPVSGAYVAPGGVASSGDFVLADFDPTLSDDAFSRGDEPLGYNFSPARYLLDPAARNSLDDPRLPALGGTGTEAVSSSACRFGDGDFWGGTNGWDFYCFLTGLQPSTDYSVLLVRYSLTVNGDLDTEEMLLDGTITQPDQLSLLGGSPGGYPEEVCDFSSARPTYTVGVTGNQNPFNMGYVTTNASGNLVFDCLVGSGGFWSAGALTDPAEAPFAPNEQTSFDLPRYNYVLVVEGTGTAADPVPAGPVVMRFQVGVDIDASGTPIPNGLAPLPDAAATDDELLFAAGGAGRPGNVSATYNNLEELAGGAEYQAWLVNPLTNAFVPAIGTYNLIKIIAERDPITGEVISTTDEVVETTYGVSSFVGGNESDEEGIGYRHQLAVNDTSMPGGPEDLVGLYTHMVLTIAASPNLSNMPESRPWWFPYTDQNGTPDDYFDDRFIEDTTVSFGNFNVTNPADSRLYSGQGQGLAGFREDEFIAEMTRLSRPPIGFELVGWLADADGNAYRLQDISGPPPERVDLSNADVEDVSGIITDNGILEAYFRGFQENLAGATWYDPNPPTPSCEAGEVVNPDRAATGLVGSDLSTFWITLEAKNGVPGMGYIPVQAAEVPQRIIRGEPECIPAG